MSSRAATMASPYSAASAPCMSVAREPGQDADELGMSRCPAVGQIVDAMDLGQLAEADQQAGALAARLLQLGRGPREQDLAQLAISEQMIELARRDIAQEEHKHPELNGDEAM